MMLTEYWSWKDLGGHRDVFHCEEDAVAQGGKWLVHSHSRSSWHEWYCALVVTGQCWGQDRLVGITVVPIVRTLAD